MKNIHLHINKQSFSERLIEASRCPHFVFKQDRSILPSWSLHPFKRLPRKEVRKRMQNVEQSLKVKILTGVTYVSDVPLK